MTPPTEGRRSRSRSPRNWGSATRSRSSSDWEEATSRGAAASARSRNQNQEGNIGAAQQGSLPFNSEFLQPAAQRVIDSALGGCGDSRIIVRKAFTDPMGDDREGEQENTMNFLSVVAHELNIMQRHSPEKFARLMSAVGLDNSNPPETDAAAPNAPLPYQNALGLGIRPAVLNQTFNRFMSAMMPDNPNPLGVGDAEPDASRFSQTRARPPVETMSAPPRLAGVLSWNLAHRRSIENLN